MRRTPVVVLVLAPSNRNWDQHQDAKQEANGKLQLFFLAEINLSERKASAAGVWRRESMRQG